MKKIILIVILSVLVACNRDDFTDQAANESLIYQNQDVQEPNYQPHNAQDIQEAQRCPVRNITAQVEEGLVIRIERATDELLYGFDRLHILDYNEVLDARDGAAERSECGENLVIWVNLSTGQMNCRKTGSRHGSILDLPHQTQVKLMTQAG